MPPESEEPPKFATLDTFPVPSRGWTVHVIEWPGGESERTLLGQEIELDGELVRVVAVETWALLDEHLARKGPHPIGVVPDAT